jgi:hypothetical protein
MTLALPAVTLSLPFAFASAFAFVFLVVIPEGDLLLYLPLLLPFCRHPPAQREDLFSFLRPILFPQKNLNKVAYFQPPKTTMQSTTIHHAIHHKITTKNHPKTLTFSKIPLKNAH